MGDSFSGSSFFHGFWNRACSVVSDMEAAGCHFDIPRCNQAAALAAQDALGLLERWQAVAPGVNPESPLQLSTLLYTTCGMPVPPICGTLKAVQRTKRGELPTGEASLDWLAKRAAKPESKELINVLMGLRRVTKLSQFLTKLPSFVDQHGFLFASFGPDTGTGRLASRNPNLQNIPGAKSDKYGIRSCFDAPPGYQLLVADYSSLEPRILAHYLIAEFGDHSLADAIAAGDVYAAIAKKTWPDKLKDIEAASLKGHPSLGKFRDYAKVILLGTNYGKGVPGLALQLELPVAQAQELYDDYFRAYPGIRGFQSLALENARKEGVARTLLGRTRPIANANSPREFEQARAQRQATNTQIQGSAADVVFGAMIKQAPLAAATGAKLQMQIHDELCLRIPHDVDPQPLIEAMEHPFKQDLLVPLKVDWKLCDNWAEGK